MGSGGARDDGKALQGGKNKGGRESEGGGGGGKAAEGEEGKNKERERERGREKGSSCNIIVSTCTLFAFLSAAEFNAAVYSAVFEDGRMKGEGRERERERERKGEREKERERTEGENG